MKTAQRLALLSSILLATTAATTTAAFSTPGLPPTPGTRLPLDKGEELFLPPGFSPRKSGEVDLLVHFHGAPSVVEEQLVRSKKVAAVVAVHLGGLSDSYRKPYADPLAFSRLLERGLAAIGSAAHGGRPVHPGRLVVSSFSAGFGAVREILSQEQKAGRSRITDVVLADSCHTGYDAQRRVRLDQLAPFTAFAELAAAGKVRLIVTHSAIVPGSYASTTETADALLAATGAHRVTAVGQDAVGRLTSTATRGGLVLRGYAGATGPDHMKHLHGLHVAFEETSLPVR